MHLNEFETSLLRYIDRNTLAAIGIIKIGIAGIGGLGSNAAHTLVRLGFRHFVLCDFDVVDTSNLNRQFYFFDQVGMYKTTALAENLRRINSNLCLDLINTKLTAENIKSVFKDCDIVIEAFDTIITKKMLIEELSGDNQILVCASGLGNEYNIEGIITRKLSSNLYMVGDQENCVYQGVAPLSPGVTVAAAKQAACVLKSILHAEGEIV